MSRDHFIVFSKTKGYKKQILKGRKIKKKYRD